MLESLRKKVRILNKTKERWEETKIYIQVKVTTVIHEMSYSHTFINWFSHFPESATLTDAHEHKNSPCLLLRITSLNITDPSSSEWESNQGGVWKASHVSVRGGGHETEGAQTGRGNQEPGDVREADNPPGADQNYVFHYQWYWDGPHSEGFTVFKGKFTAFISTTQHCGNLSQPW